MVLIFIIGLTLGSFASVLITRLPQNNITLWQRSHCCQCTHILEWFELIPIFSWCIQKGRCRYCNHSIPLLYPFLEGTVALWFITCFNFPYSNQENFLIAILGYFFILAIVTDFREKIIPNWANVGIAIIILLLQGPEYKNIFLILISTFITLLICLSLKSAFKKINNVHALGDGDIKLMCALSLGLEMQQLSLWFILSGGLGLFTGIIWSKIKQEKKFPFGPALIVGFVIMYLSS
jgi:prepilin signal peptidase PulO-like enzyme (type II secretory pathway)